MSREIDRSSGKLVPAIRHLPGLDGLRALAATIVLFWHVDRFSLLFGLEPAGYGVTGMAESAVTLFFVLSGYLITALLLLEHEQFGCIDIQRFYARRALRIWPLYYLAITLSIILAVWLPEIGRPQAYQHYLFYVFFIPNVAYAYGLGIFSILPLWSVGVEEQFYLVWPWIIRRSRNLFRTLFLIAAIYLAFKIGLRLLENGPLYRLWRLTSVDSLAMGSAMAWAVHTKQPWLSKVFSKPVQLVSWALLATFILVKPLHITSALSAECHSLVYVCLIANVSQNPKTLIRLEWPPLKFLGRISYGLYLFHLPIMIVLGRWTGQFFRNLGPPGLGFVVAALCTYMCSILAATLSLYLIEMPFLKLKHRLSRLAPRTRTSV